MAEDGEERPITFSVLHFPFRAGYGHIAPSTMAGKIFTIVYALIGMPLFLLYLANIGDIMANAFKWTYSRCCKLRRQRQARKRGGGGGGMAGLQAHFEAAGGGFEVQSLEGMAMVDGDNAVQMITHDDEDEEDGLTESSGSSVTGKEIVAIREEDEDAQSDENDAHKIVVIDGGDDEGYSDEEDDDLEDDEDREGSSGAGGRYLDEYSDSGSAGSSGSGSSDSDEPLSAVTVPVTLSLALMVSYIVGGAVLFAGWEQWSVLEGAYFCFITLRYCWNRQFKLVLIFHLLVRSVSAISFPDRRSPVEGTTTREATRWTRSSTRSSSSARCTSCWGWR